MKKILTLICLVSATNLTNAALIADWNFNSDTTVSHGSGTLTLALASGSDASIGSSSTAINEVSGDSAGKGLYIASGTKGANPDYPENGKSIIFTINMTGFQNLVLTYATEKTSTGFNSQNWSYSINGGEYTSFTTITGMGTTYTSTGVETVDFSTVTGINNISSVSIELTLNGSTGGSDHFDNIQFNADEYIPPVPEPATWGAISVFGLLGICGLREWRQRRQNSGTI